MKTIAAAFCLTLLAACSTLPAGTSATRTIIVDGEASFRVMPDTFAVRAALVTRNSDQSAGLVELSSRLAQVKDSLPALAGLKHLQINSGDISLMPIYDMACMGRGGYGLDNTCPITGRIGTINLQIQGSPADRAGQVVSLLSQLGAESVELQSFTLSNMKSERDRAIAQAVEDARTKANAIAGAAGAKVMGLERVQFGNGFDSDRGGDNFSVMAVWNEAPPGAGLLMPTVDLDVTPSPIEVSAKIVASFSVE